MRLLFGIFAALVSPAAAAYKSIPMGDVPADSALGMNLLSKARRLNNDNAVDITWISGYSLKFQGCHNIQQWNADADGDEDVRISTKGLVRFRLCPQESCTATSAGGCDSGYGDYVLDLNTFANAFFEATRKSDETECQTYYENNCNCEDDDGKGDDFDEEKCQYDCYADAGMESYCTDKNPYEEGEAQEEFNVEEYMECKEFRANNENGEQQGYYMGPYCAEQGGSVFLGLFTDDSCTTLVDESGGKDTYLSLTGSELPYSAVSIVGSKCVTCLDADQGDNNAEDAANNAQVLDVCEQIYYQAGKCEQNLPDGIVSEENNQACNYIEGIKIIRQDGMSYAASSKPNAAVTAFIVIFALSTAALAFYVYYLRMRLGVKQNTLL